jgi:hypothetical protein
MTSLEAKTKREELDQLKATVERWSSAKSRMFDWCGRGYNQVTCPSIVLHHLVEEAATVCMYVDDKHPAKNRLEGMLTTLLALECDAVRLTIEGSSKSMDHLRTVNANRKTYYEPKRLCKSWRWRLGRANRSSKRHGLPKREKKGRGCVDDSLLRINHNDRSSFFIHHHER